MVEYETKMAEIKKQQDSNIRSTYFKVALEKAIQPLSVLGEPLTLNDLEKMVNNLKNLLVSNQISVDHQQFN